MSKKNRKKSNRGNQAATKRMNEQLGITEEKVKVFGSGEEKTVTVFNDIPEEKTAQIKKSGIEENVSIPLDSKPFPDVKREFKTPELEVVFEEKKEARKPAADRKKEEKSPESRKLAEKNAAVEEDNEETGSKTEEIKEYIPVKKQKPHREESFSDSVNEALGEDYEILNEEISPVEEPAAERERPNRFYLVFAIFVIIMSIVGIVSTCIFVKDGISDIVNQTGLKNDIALFLYPVVSVDPPECNEVKELPSTIVVESAIWRIILTGDNSNYEKQYNTYMYVPAVDVEYSIRSIYGSSAVIQHQTVGGADASFVYHEDTNSYLVPINPRYSAYSPRITEVSSVGELYTVKVDYIPPSALAVEGIEFENPPTKTMVYTLSMSKNSMTIHSIKNTTKLEDTYEY